MPGPVEKRDNEVAKPRGERRMSRGEASTVALKNACGGATEPTGLSDGIREEFETMERAWRSDEEGTH